MSFGAEGLKLLLLLLSIERICSVWVVVIVLIVSIEVDVVQLARTEGARKPEVRVVVGAVLVGVRTRVQARWRLWLWQRLALVRSERLLLLVRRKVRVVRGSRRIVRLVGLIWLVRL